MCQTTASRPLIRRTMTPLEISIALHYHTRSDQFREGDFSGTAVQEALAMFVAAGLLEEKGWSMRGTFRQPNYQATGGLKVYVEALCAVPLPVNVWQMPAG